MVEIVKCHEFLALPGVLLDVRSPGEYAEGHILGALNLPLFSNEERAKVGTCYKQQGREAAIELGLELVGPKLASFVQQAKQMADDHASDRTVRVHCWRGGMRSSSMAWLLETAGFSVCTLAGGYKAFRGWVREVLAIQKPIVTLGGMTGTGKTEVLQALASLGEPVVDLEALAHHRGSSYGSLGLPPQPTQEQFENTLAPCWAKLGNDRPIWIEAESRRIGLCRIPDALFQPMMRAPVIQIARSRADRIARLVHHYGTTDPTGLIAATERLRKRLGGLRTQQAVALIQAGNLAAAIDIVLDYYDKTYTYDLHKRKVPIHTVEATGLNAEQTAYLLMTTVQNLSLSST